MQGKDSANEWRMAGAGLACLLSCEPVLLATLGLKKKKNERGKYLTSPGSFSEWPQQPGIGEAEARSFIQDSHVGAGAWALFHCLFLGIFK